MNGRARLSPDEKRKKENLLIQQVLILIRYDEVVSCLASFSQVSPLKKDYR
jgi:hypothetical protein